MGIKAKEERHSSSSRTKKEAASVESDDDNPYPYTLEMTHVTEKADAGAIQEFFRPHKAIAVNIGDDGDADVAFASHEEAEDAMEKHGQKLLGHRVKLKLTSCKPKRVEGRSSVKRESGRDERDRYRDRDRDRGERSERSREEPRRRRDDDRR